MKKILRVLICIILALTCFNNIEIFKAETNIIRIGYIPYESFVNFNDDGSYSGYGIDYIDKMNTYLGYEYELVDGSLNELLELLNNNEIDILMGVNYNEARLDKFAYVNTPIIESSTMLYSLKDTDIYYNEYEQINGKTVGLIEGEYAYDDFNELVEEYNINCNVIYYANHDVLKKALDNGSVDLMAISSLFGNYEYKEILKMGTNPIYFLTSKNNMELNQQLDWALKQIKRDSPYFEMNNYVKHYGNEHRNTIPTFTREEINYIKRRREPVKIGVNEDGYLLAYRDENGKHLGIKYEILDLISNISKLSFEYIPYTSNEEASRLMENKDVDLLAAINRSYLLAQDNEILISSVLYNNNAVAVTEKGNTLYSLNNLKVAVLKSNYYIASRLRTEYKNIEIVDCDNDEELFLKVNNGDCDALVHDEYNVSYQLQKSNNENLQIVPGLTVHQEKVIIGVDEIDPILFSIINKSIDALGKKDIDNIIVNYTIGNPYKASFSDYLYKYRLQIAGSVALLIIVLMILIKINIVKAETVMMRKQDEKHRRLIEHDSLTGLLSKDAFYKKAEKIIKEDTDNSYMIVTSNIDRFKVFNDISGSKEGDRLLRYIANCIMNDAIRFGGIAGRLSSDNFVQLLKYNQSIIDNLNNNMQEKLKSSPYGTKIQLRFGVYIILDREVPVNKMCDRANLASDKIKGNELQRVAIYESKYRENLLEQQVIIENMHVSLENEEFDIYIQPKVNIATNEIVGGEALVRWQLPNKGYVPCSLYIPIFEENGFIAILDAYIWEKTCAFLSECKKQNIKMVPISVNISRVDFFKEDIVQILLSLINKYDLTTNDLELEITESAYFEDNDIINRTIETLQSYGFRILMDDFGSGYSSFGMLKNAPVDILKLDMTFMDGNDDKNRLTKILSSIVYMADALDIAIISEGIETEEQVEMLKKVGCAYAQGFYFSKAVNKDEFIKLVQESLLR